MKVLVFTTQFYLLSGAERLAVELAEELNKGEMHADIMTMYTEDLPGVKKAKASLLAMGIPKVHFLNMTIHPSITSLVPAILRLRKVLREGRYNIIETSSVSTTVIAAWATLGLETRHVAGLHRVFIRDRENSLNHLFWRFSVRCSSQIRFYGISNFVTAAWISYSNTLPSHSRTVYNGIFRDYFEVSPAKSEVRRELGILDQGKIILYVGRLAKYKGLDTIFEAVSHFLKEKKCYLIYVGQLDENVRGSDEMIQCIKKKAKAIAVQDHVKFLGYRKDVPRLMASSDILVHPTKIEGFGLVLIEAMATGLQVVTSNVEGIPEVLKGTDSIMIPPGDPDALRNAVLEVLHRPPEAIEDAIAKGRKQAEKFRMKRRIQDMITLFKGVLNGSF